MLLILIIAVLLVAGCCILSNDRYGLPLGEPIAWTETDHYAELGNVYGHITVDKSGDAMWITGTRDREIIEHGEAANLEAAKIACEEAMRRLQ